jgi:serine/threonine-protein kinase
MTTSVAFTNLAASLAGRYRIERELGRGGMATVYLAHDIKHDRKVAIKVLDPELGAVLGAERFLSEIKVTANLQHPNLLPLFDSGEANGLLYYVMPFVEGETLRARLERDKQLSIESAVGIAVAVAYALAYAHERGIVHRDLKPENILFQAKQPVVADFGIALAVSNAGGQRVTQTGVSVGTPQYMSPEQAIGDRSVDARADIYALGAVLYEMLTGAPPHTGASAQAVIAKLLTEEPQSVSVVRRNVPPHVDAAVRRALEKLPADRFETAKDFAVALTNPLAYVQQPVAAEVSRRRSVAARARDGAIAVIAVAGTAGTVYFATRHPPPPVVGHFNVELPDSVHISDYDNPALALSRDGTRLVIAGELQDGARALYLRRLDDPVAQRIAGTDGAIQPTFSYDGATLLFRVNTKLVRIPVTGGVVQTVVDSVNGQATAWGPDDQILFSRGRSLWVVSANGGAPRRVADPDTARGIGSISEPDFLPGGRHALVSIHGKRTDVNGSLGVVSIDDGAVTGLGVPGVNPHYVAPGFIVFVRNGEAFAAPFSLRRRAVTGEPVRFLEHVFGTSYGRYNIAFAQNGTLAVHSLTTRARDSLGLFIVDRSGAARRVAGGRETMHDPRVSPDGRRVVGRIGSGAGSGDLWIVELATGARSRITTNRRSWRADWSADGKRLDYLSGPDVGSIIASRPWDQSSDERVLLSAESTGPRAALQGFSAGPPHGYSAIRVGSRRASQSADIWIAPSDSLTALRSFLTSPADELQPRVSPDGKLLAYTSNESGRDEVYVTKLPGPAAHVIVSVNGGTEPAWSADGTMLFYRGNTRMMAATLAARGEPTIAKRDSLFVDRYYRYSGVTEYDVFPDKQHFLMLRSVNDRWTGGSVSFIVNWPRMLERATSATVR